jgi:16S rRNA processing protein RimM
MKTTPRRARTPPRPTPDASVTATRRVVVGRLTGVFGVRGELKCRPTSLGDGAFAAGRTFALGAGPDARTLTCASARRHHEKLLLAFAGIVTPEAARALAGAELYADVADVALGPDEYLDADLIGLRLVDESGRDLGTVVGVEHYPAQDCLVVGASRALVPLVKAFIARIDVPGRIIETTLPEGLLEA